jgi:hypothetical protein
MLRKDKIQVWANILKAVDARLEALKQIDPVIYSKSRVIGQCVEAHLPKVEAVAQPSFNPPAHEAPSRTSRRRRTVA